MAYLMFIPLEKRKIPRKEFPNIIIRSDIYGKENMEDKYEIVFRP